MLRSTGEFIEQ